MIKKVTVAPTIVTMTGLRDMTQWLVSELQQCKESYGTFAQDDPTLDVAGR